LGLHHADQRTGGHAMPKFRSGTGAAMLCQMTSGAVILTLRRPLK
jgi:hypothetical protein